MDLLSSILSSLKAESTIISRWRLSAPWGVDVVDFDPGYCLSIVEGHCWLEIPHGQPQRLVAGDSLLAPRGGKCALRSSPGAKKKNLNELPWRGERFEGLDAFTQPASASKVSWGGGGSVTRLVGLAFTFQHPSNDFLISALPEFIVHQGGTTDMLSFMHPAMELLTDDTQPGYFAIAKQISELVIIELMRNHILSTDTHPVGWLRGIQDRHVSKALTAIHTNPRQHWSVALLASVSGISRSAFSARFSKIVGSPPMVYLHQWRTRLATEKLTNSRQSVAVIAQELGYESDRVFRQVFRKHAGMSPRDYRKQFTGARHNPR